MDSFPSSIRPTHDMLYVLDFVLPAGFLTDSRFWVNWLKVSVLMCGPTRRAHVKLMPNFLKRSSCTAHGPSTCFLCRVGLATGSWVVSDQLYVGPRQPTCWPNPCLALTLDVVANLLCLRLNKTFVGSKCRVVNYSLHPKILVKFSFLSISHLY